MDRDTDTLARRLRLARKKRGLSQGELATKAGLKQPDISKIELGLIEKTTGIARLSRVLGVTAEWLESGDGPLPDWSVYRDTMPLVGPTTPALAHPMILDVFTVPPSFTWEEVEGMTQLPERFTILMPDDSLAGHIEKGSSLIFERDLAPTPSKTVLLEDSDGHRFIRSYALVRGDHWQAQPKASGYVTLDSKEHGLKVLATLKWRED